MENSISFADAAQDWQLGFQDPATPMMEGIIFFHNYLFFYLVFIVVFVSWLLFRCLTLYSEEVHPNPDIFNNLDNCTSTNFIIDINSFVCFTLFYGRSN